MASFEIWVYLGCIFIVCSQLLHISSAEDQQNRNRPSVIPDADVSKPFTWTLPAPKPENKKDKKGHREGGGKSVNECNCNCNCDCEKTHCKDEGREKGPGPVVCMPMECNAFGCKLGGGMKVEADNTIQIPTFMAAGGDQQGRTRPSDSMNSTAAGHH